MITLYKIVFTPYRTAVMPTQQYATAASERLDWFAEKPPENAANSTGKGSRADTLASELLVELWKAP
jgi:hypothetical protein